MKNENVFLFPNNDSDLDGFNEDSLYEVVDIDAGKFLGVVGVRLPADSVNGYDAVYGWQDPFGVKSGAPFFNLSDASDDLVNHALTNGEES
jgi:hypothetical protein